MSVKAEKGERRETCVHCSIRFNSNGTSIITSIPSITILVMVVLASPSFPLYKKITTFSA